MITYSPSGNALSPDARAALDRAIQRLARHRSPPPRRPTGPLKEPASSLEPGTGTATFDGADPEVNVTFSLPAGWEARQAGPWSSRAPTPSHWSGSGRGSASSMSATSSPTHVARYWRTRPSARPWTTSSRRSPTCPATPPPPETSPSTGSTASRSSSRSPTTPRPAASPFFLAVRQQQRRLVPGLLGPGPNQHNRVRILDVDGTRLMILGVVPPRHLGRGSSRPRGARQLDRVRLKRTAR